MAAEKQSSKMNRLEIGDVVAYEDGSTWPPTHMEGPISSFANDTLTHITVDFPDGARTLTEEEVTRIA
mgnify:CR=1 FL=1